MKIYSYLSYRALIRDRLKSLKLGPKKLGTLKLAEMTGLHSSFVSSVLQEHKHFNSDQVYSVCEAVGFTGIEIDYILLLHSCERSTQKGLKSKYFSEIKKIQEESKKVHKVLSVKKQKDLDLILSEYYSDPYFKIIHVHLSVPRFNKSPLLLADELMLPVSKITHCLEKLEEFGIIKQDKGGVKVLKRHLHLPKDFFICQAHQTTMKSISQQKIMNLPKDKKETFCVTFSGTKKTYSEVHEAFLEFLKKSENCVKDAKSENVFQMTFDLHHWS